MFRQNALGWIQREHPVKRDAKKKKNGKAIDPDIEQRLLADVEQIYAEWEARPISRNCTGRAMCCRFGLTGKTPYLTKGEAMVAARAWKASGRRALPSDGEGSCPFLKNQICQNYAARPFGCRTHFCEAAGGPAPRAQVRDLIQRLEDIDRALGGEGAVNLPTALRAHL